MARDKKKVSSYLTPDLKERAERLAESRQMSLSTLIAVLLDRETKSASKS